jgi:hypothetical protein
MHRATRKSQRPRTSKPWIVRWVYVPPSPVQRAALDRMWEFLLRPLIGEQNAGNDVPSEEAQSLPEQGQPATR